MPPHANSTSADIGLDAFGCRPVESKGSTAAVHGERDLWCAVIAQAFADIGAIVPSTSSAAEPTRAYGREFDEAVRWLLRDKSDFPYVCDLAGVSSHVIRRAAQVFYGNYQLALGERQEEKEGMS